jgi:hypothetical protein
MRAHWVVLRALALAAGGRGMALRVAGCGASGWDRHTGRRARAGHHGSPHVDAGPHGLLRKLAAEPAAGRAQRFIINIQRDQVEPLRAFLTRTASLLRTVSHGAWQAAKINERRVSEEDYAEDARGGSQP